MAKTVKLVAAAVITIAVLWIIPTVGKSWFSGQVGKIEERIAAVDKKVNAQLVESQNVIQAKDEENARLRAKDATGEREKAALRKELAAVRADLNEAQEKLKTAPPEELLAKTREWLMTDEIWLRATAGATEGVFSLAAFRTNAMALDRGRRYEFSIVPKLEADIRIQEGQLLAVRADRDNYKDTIVPEKDKQLGAKDEKMVERDKAIADLKRKNLWKDILNFLKGLAVGLAASFLK